MNGEDQNRKIVGRVPPPGVPSPTPTEPTPRRLRRLDRIWPDRDGNISYLLTPCVDGRARVLDNEETFQRLVAFLLDSPERYDWFGRRFVIMPDHIHLIAHMGNDAVRLGQWIKAFKSVVGGLERQDGCHDHKFRTPESESRKWEYVCLNPVRYGLVHRPEEWPYGGEIFYDEAGGPRLLRGTPPLLECGLLIEEDSTLPERKGTPGGGTRPTI